MERVAIIGTGYVGLVSAACLAELGNKVICVDNDKKKLEGLKKGIIPIYEPGLDELVRKNAKAKRLIFTTSIREATEKSQIIFICVSTPPLPDGSADLTAVEDVTAEIARAMKEYKLIVGKSTVPTQTHEKIKRTIKMITRDKIVFDVASNPEFLREGHAVRDTLFPDRVVVGVESSRAEKLLRQLYKPLKTKFLVTNITTAELIKYARNCFLSTKISYINAISQICERINADVEKVAEGIGLDVRINPHFLKAGAGFGGNCLPKDLEAFIRLAEKKGYDFELLKAVRKINTDQKRILLKKMEEALWIVKNKTIAVWGLTFKPNTDDIRNSVAIEIVKMFQQEKAKIQAYDPKGMPKAKVALKGVTFCKTAYDALRGADALLILTEWDEFKNINLEKVKKLLRQPVIVDGRNIFSPSAMSAQGFIYKCIGRGSDLA